MWSFLSTSLLSLGSFMDAARTPSPSPSPHRTARGSQVTAWSISSLLSFGREKLRTEEKYAGSHAWPCASHVGMVLFRHTAMRAPQLQALFAGSHASLSDRCYS